MSNNYYPPPLNPQGSNAGHRYDGQQQGYYPPPQPPQQAYGQQQQQYAQPSYAAPQNPPPNKEHGGQQYPNQPPPPYTFEQRFAVPKPRYNDIWAAVLFVFVFCGLLVVSGVALNGYRATYNGAGNGIYGNRNSFGLTTNTVILFIFVLLLALMLSAGHFLIMRRFTKQLIWITGILNIVVGIGTAIYYFVRHYYSAAIVFMIFALFYAFCFWTWRRRIPFSVLMLQTAVDVAEKYGHTFRVALLGAIVGLAAAAWFSVTFIAVYIKWTPNSNNAACQVNGGGCSNAKVIGLLVFIVFAFYWLSEIIKTVIHVAVSGVYGSWYFCSRTQMPKHPTLGAFKRAMTYSFGSICLGSLIVSIIQLLREAASIASQNEAMEGDIISCILWGIASCILGLLQWLIEFFNDYAFSYIALYGDAYIPAARSTWRMMKDRGLDALINDCLIDPVMTMGSVFVGYMCSFLAYLYLLYTNPSYNTQGQYTAVVMAFSFLIGVQMANIFHVPINSGTSTIFTCMAHDPDVMVRDHPELYSKMVRVYPHVQQMIHA